MGDGEAREATADGTWGGVTVEPAMGSTAAEIDMHQEPATDEQAECVAFTRALCVLSVVALLKWRVPFFELVCTLACVCV